MDERTFKSEVAKIIKDWTPSVKTSDESLEIKMEKKAMNHMAMELFSKFDINPKPEVKE